MNTKLTPALIHDWAHNGIVARYFPDLDTCEETVRGHEDLVFVKVRTSPTQWQLTMVRPATAYHIKKGKPVYE